MKQKFKINRITTITEEWELELEIPVIDLDQVIYHMRNSEADNKKTETNFQIESVWDNHHFYVVDTGIERV